MFSTSFAILSLLSVVVLQTLAQSVDLEVSPDIAIRGSVLKVTCIVQDPPSDAAIYLYCPLVTGTYCLDNDNRVCPESVCKHADYLSNQLTTSKNSYKNKIIMEYRFPLTDDSVVSLIEKSSFQCKYFGRLSDEKTVKIIDRITTTTTTTLRTPTKAPVKPRPPQNPSPDKEKPPSEKPEPKYEPVPSKTSPSSNPSKTGVVNPNGKGLITQFFNGIDVEVTNRAFLGLLIILAISSILILYCCTRCSFIRCTSNPPTGCWPVFFCAKEEIQAISDLRAKTYIEHQQKQHFYTIDGVPLMDPVPYQYSSPYQPMGNTYRCESDGSGTGMPLKRTDSFSSSHISSVTQHHKPNFRQVLGASNNEVPQEIMLSCGHPVSSLIHATPNSQQYCIDCNPPSNIHYQMAFQHPTMAHQGTKNISCPPTVISHSPSQNFIPNYPVQKSSSVRGSTKRLSQSSPKLADHQILTPQQKMTSQQLAMAHQAEMHNNSNPTLSMDAIFRHQQQREIQRSGDSGRPYMISLPPNVIPAQYIPRETTPSSCERTPTPSHRQFHQVEMLPQVARYQPNTSVISNESGQKSQDSCDDNTML